MDFHLSVMVIVLKVDCNQLSCVDDIKNWYMILIGQIKGKECKYKMQICFQNSILNFSEYSKVLSISSNTIPLTYSNKIKGKNVAAIDNILKIVSD